MKIITKQEFREHMDGYASQVKSGSIMIYPTDTIYGIGCNALLDKSVSKIRELKDNPPNPFSVIVPSKEWIYDNCEVPPEAEEWIAQLPGPFTLILPLKKNSFFSTSVSPNLDTIGIRIPDHYIREFVEKLGYPLITTSVNK
ncbi:MAG: L-threonylcarbamoyladenylate synthase, partial [Candidatus Woesearchaeota archaeon]